MLEYCYKNEYTVPEEIRYNDARAQSSGSLLVAQAKSAMLHHLHVMVVADKYMVDGLVDQAFNRFSRLVTESKELHEAAVVQLFDDSHQIPSHDSKSNIFYRLNRALYSTRVSRVFCRVFYGLLSYFWTPLRNPRVLLDNAPPLERARTLVISRAQELCSHPTTGEFEYMRNLGREVPTFAAALLDKALEERIPLLRRY